MILGPFTLCDEYVDRAVLTSHKVGSEHYRRIEYNMCLYE